MYNVEVEDRDEDKDEDRKRKKGFQEVNRSKVKLGCDDMICFIVSYVYSTSGMGGSTSKGRVELRLESRMVDET